MGTLKLCIRLGLRVLAIPLVHGGLSAYSEACPINTEKNDVLVEVFYVSPTDAVLPLDFVSESRGYRYAISR